jgi:hypothetical protein
VKAEAKDLEAWWADLSSSDAGKAHAAIGKLIAVPRQVVPLLRTALTPAESAPADRLAQLLKDLDSEEFEQREAASRQPAELEERVFPALERALQGNPSPEKRRRIEALLADPCGVRSPATVRCLRAVEVLEHIGTPEAKEVLQMLARGAPEARLTQSAKTSLERLAVRPGPAP